MYLKPAGAYPIDRLAEFLARMATVFRGDGHWLCGAGIACGFHLKCRETGADSPRGVKEEPVPLYCYCHNCDQRRRRSTKRPRWTQNIE